MPSRFARLTLSSLSSLALVSACGAAPESETDLEPVAADSSALEVAAPASATVV
jgi:hypothetical protein